MGRLFVVCGPSGVGKSTLVQALLKRLPDLRFSVSYTTRPRRPHEREGVHYLFVSEETFARLKGQGELLEHTLFNGHWYGTSASWVRAQLEEGHDVVLEIDVKGAQQIRALQAQLGVPVTFLFILPPSPQELRRRIRRRATEDEADRRRRLRLALEELKQAPQFDYQVVNDDLDRALEELQAIVQRVRGRA